MLAAGLGIAYFAGRESGETMIVEACAQTRRIGERVGIGPPGTWLVRD